MAFTDRVLLIRLVALESPRPGTQGFMHARPGHATMEFHVSGKARELFGMDESLFSSSGNAVIPDFKSVRMLSQRMNEELRAALHPERAVKAGSLNAMGLIDEILHYVCHLYREQMKPDAFIIALEALDEKHGDKKIDALLLAFCRLFPSTEVHRGDIQARAWLSASSDGVPNRALALEELLMLRLSNENPAFSPFGILFDDSALAASTIYADAMESLVDVFEGLPHFGPEDQNLAAMLRAPREAAPNSLPGQLDYIRTHWGMIISSFLMRLLKGMDFIKEEEKNRFPGPGPARVLVYEGMEHEYERFSPDKDWMPRVVMMAKSTLVWLWQLSVKYGRQISRLDQIPDEELDILSSRGYNGLWLIGLWERSAASARIKHICGNPEAAPSAYSLFDNDIAAELGGWDALASLRERCAWRGIKLAADMVPNHTGIDSAWVRERPDLFLSAPWPPFPGYTFNGENLSGDPSIGIYLEDHYYSKNDAAVVFKRVDHRSGDTRYLYHGNDGTSMPWNDTAQIDFLNPQAREAVIGQILRVAHNFPIIRFDAAMVLARKHIRRLWYPEPGQGGDIPSRAEHSLPREDFDARMPQEFWREVVDRCAAEVPDTLLLAEAFWMLEGYFVRTLGMHRVYNSAFMNMLKREENEKYRSTIKNTMEFDKDILKRFVNFMNNPDEDTAVAQFGSGDKYFGVCTMMVTMPGLPMFGHGQVEGFTERYGMEYRRAYRDEHEDGNLVARHEHEIFPLMKRRHVFSGVEHFLLYDLYSDSGAVDENVFAYSNACNDEHALVVYNNAYARCSGWLRMSAAFMNKGADGSKKLERMSIGQGLRLSGDSKNFLLMREQRSSLWFIRNSRDFMDRGLFVSLDGFRCQVFMDIHEIADNELRQYRALCEALEGAGTNDIANALQDIALEELYKAFSRLAGAEFFASVRARALVSPSKSQEAFLDSLRQNAKEFQKTARVFLDGTSTYAAFPQKRENDDSDDESLAQYLSSAFEAFFTLFSSKNAYVTEAVSLIPHAAEFCAADIILQSLSCVLGNRSSGGETRALCEHWCLDRKLREALEAAGVPGDSAWRAIAIAKTLLSHADRNNAGREQNLLDPSSGMPAADELREIMEVHGYDGTIWFNKERFEALVFFAFAGMVFKPAAESDRDTAGARIKEASAHAVKLLKAATGSEYRFDILLKLLSPVKAASPKKRKTNATLHRSSAKDT